MATATYVDTRVHMETVVRPSTARFYAPELDALRFAAFLLVFGRHVSNAIGFAKRGAGIHSAQASVPGSSAVGSSHGFSFWTTLQETLQAFDFGVCLFFFLSAFLITRLLLMERASTGKVAVRQFYIRRCLRIWPLYFFFLALVVALSQVVPALHVSVSRVLAAVFFVANWAAVLHGWQSIAIQPLWSVSVEEQFYLVWPLFARWGRKSIVAVSSALSVVAVLALFYLGHRGGTEVTAVWPNTLVQGLFLSAGALTACFSSPETRRKLSGGKRVAMILSGGVLWVGAAAGCHVVRFASPGAASLIGGYLLVLAGTFLIFSGVAGWNPAAVPGWLSHAGKMSYGLYVFHVACLLLMEEATRSLWLRWPGVHVSPYSAVAMSSTLALALTVACAALSYQYLERPFLKLKDRFTVVQSRPA